MNQSYPIVDLGSPIAAVVASGLAQDMVTIHAVDESITTGGVQKRATGAAVSGLTDLPCMIGYNLLRSRVQRSQEDSAKDETTQLDELHCLITGYYPAITKEQRAVAVRGGETDTWDIQGIDWDSQRTMTTLTLVRVRQ